MNFMGTVPSAVWDGVRRAGRGAVGPVVAAGTGATEVVLALFVDGVTNLRVR